VNGRFHASGSGDEIAAGLEKDQTAALDGMPSALSALPRDEFPLLPFDMVGIDALKALFSTAEIALPPIAASQAPVTSLPPISRLVDELATGSKGLVMVMGKGGVGKTTVAAAIAVGLAARGHPVHLTTTDPAAHVSLVVDGAMAGLTVDRIDPAAETERYIAKIMATQGKSLDDDGRALLLEDLASPCTEEVAVFHAFSRIVAEARTGFVVIDTAPTGHTLLLLDATGAYHRQMTRHIEPTAPGRMVTPLMRLQDPAYTKVILVALAETTPVSEAAMLQGDLRRASIEPFAWVINKSMSASGTTDRLLQSRIQGERAQIERVTRSLSKRTFLLPFKAASPVGIEALRTLAAPPDAAYPK
jgi:arsenite/tail-anchored protein-transporting ATPase